MITRSSIRKGFIRSGECRGDPEKLERMTNAMYHFVTEESFGRMRLQHGRPAKGSDGVPAMFAKVKFANDQMPERNLTRIFQAVKSSKAIYLYGSGAAWAAWAALWQLIFRDGYVGVYREMSDLYEALEEPQDYGMPRKSVMILDTTFDAGDGKIWLEHAHKIKKSLKHVEGGIIFINTDGAQYPSGKLGNLLAEIWPPEERLKVTKR